MNKKKNILDLEYNTELNNRTIFLVLLGTALITVMFGNVDADSKVIYFSLIFIGFAFILDIYNERLEVIKNKIKRL